MSVINIIFLSQPNVNDVIGFDVNWDNGQSSSISIEFGVDVAIGLTLSETIQNTEDYLALFTFNNGFPRFRYTISNNELIITDFLVQFTASNFVSVVGVVIVSGTPSFVIYNKINIRSPYKILVDEVGQEGSKIELFFWNKGTTKPTIPQHILSKRKVSNFQTANEYNISEFAKEYITPIAPETVASPSEENVKTWCYMEVKRYKLVSGSYSQIDTLNFVCINGFTSYQDGLNKSSIEQQILLSDNSFKRLQSVDNSHYVNVWLEPASYSFTGLFYIYNFTVDTEGIWILPLKDGINTLSIQMGEQIFSINTENQCEPIYTPLKLSFINRYGGWEFITLFKNSVNSFSSNSQDYNLLPASSDYDIRQGQKRKFNFSLMQKVKCNTGFVPQGYGELIKDLIVSEVILLDNKPATLITQSFEEKTHLKDNNINYELEFEYNYNLINDVV